MPGYEQLESDLKRRLQKVYGDRIIAERPRKKTPYGLKHWMRIKLPPPEQV